MAKTKTAATKAVASKTTTKAAAKPAAKPVAVPKTKVAVPAKVAVAPAKAKVSAKPKGEKNPSVSAQQRGHYVEIAAYFIAERRGFAPGNQMDDWLAAEREVERLIAEGKLGG